MADDNFLRRRVRGSIERNAAVSPEEHTTNSVLWWGVGLAVLAVLFPPAVLPSFVLGVIAVVRGRVGAGVFIMVAALVLFWGGIQWRVVTANAEASPWSLADRAEVAVVGSPRFIVEPCPVESAVEGAATGCTWMIDGAPIYIRPEYADDWFVVYHELGHRFDYEVMTSIWRREYVRARSRTWRSWSHAWVEDFADSYAFCAHDRRRLDIDGAGYDPMYGNRSHQAVCRIIDAAARAGSRAKWDPSRFLGANPRGG